jgi:hypothetical protein
MRRMADKTVRDEQILTERKFPRRSFLTATGALLAGAVAIASGVRASAQEQKATDPDTKDKPKKTMKKSKMHKKGSDPDKKKKMTKSKAKAKTPPKSDPDGARL